MASTLPGGNGWIKHQPSPYQQGDITHFPDWHKLIVLDAFFNNLTSGLMVVATLLWWFGPAMCTFMLPMALTVALALVITDLLILVADLGDSCRFYHCMRVMRFTSPLSVGVWGLVAYASLLAPATALQWLVLYYGPAAPFFIMLLARLCTIMAFLGAIVVICYKGVVFSCSSQPGLCQARWFTPFMVSDSLLMGMGLYLFIALCCGAGFNTMTIVMPFAFLVAARCLTFWLLWHDVRKRAREIYPEENVVISITVYVVAGLVPFFLVFFGIWGILLSSLLVLACGVFERAWAIGLARPRTHK